MLEILKFHQLSVTLIQACSDYAGDVDTRRSTTGFVFFMSNGPVCWLSQRRKIVTLSTTEAEYVSASAASREAVWLRRLLKDIGFGRGGKIMMNLDNQSALRLVRNP